MLDSQKLIYISVAASVFYDAVAQRVNRLERFHSGVAIVLLFAFRQVRVRNQTGMQLLRVVPLIAKGQMRVADVKEAERRIGAGMNRHG